MKNQIDNQQAFDSLTRAGLDATRSMMDAFGEFARTLNAANPLLNGQASACCDIPPACWMPKCFGQFESRACPFGTALLRVHVNNCQPTSSDIRIAVKNHGDLEVDITPRTATLGAMECKWFTVAVTIPEDVCKGEIYELIVWVAGCNEHYARWNIQVADGASGTCIDTEIKDCPDYVHHWYDHFYCARPCFARGRKDDQ